jgi:hypothetical protein
MSTNTSIGALERIKRSIDGLSDMQVLACQLLCNADDYESADFDSHQRKNCFVSDNVWGSADRQFVFRHIAEYLVQAWDVRNTCKHSGAVLPFPSAPVGRGVDGIDAMA